MTLSAREELDMTVGFIGCGNMAQAMIKGIVATGDVSPEEVWASDMAEPVLEKASQTIGIQTTADNCQVASQADVLVLAVKPQFYYTVINQIKTFVEEETLVVSIAPGQSLDKLGQAFGRPVKLIRTMPNTPALVGAGMTAMCYNDQVSADEAQRVSRLLAGCGRVEQVAEYMMDAVVAVSGSSPAYVFMMIEAMADAAVLKGMARQTAYTFAAQAVYGSAKMVLETMKHPAELKDMVCSPAGTTIEAVKVLETEGFRQSIIKAMVACADRSAAL